MTGTSRRPGRPEPARTQDRVAAAYDTLEGIRLVLNGRAEDAGHLLPPFVMAAAAAADARDALAFAPSLAAAPAGPPPLDFGQLEQQDASAVAAALGEAARVLTTRLTLASLTATDPRDRTAFVAASRHAASVHSYLAGVASSGTAAAG